MTAMMRDKLHQYVENMDDYQLELVYSFVVTLFDLNLDLDPAPND